MMAFGGGHHQNEFSVVQVLRSMGVSHTAHERFHDINRFLCTRESISNAIPQLCFTDSDVCWETERFHHSQSTRDNTFNMSDRRGTGIKLQGHSWVTSHSGISIVWPTPITKTINETELQPILCVAYIYYTVCFKKMDER